MLKAVVAVVLGGAGAGLEFEDGGKVHLMTDLSGNASFGGGAWWAGRSRSG